MSILYDQIMMDHIKNARNYRGMEKATNFAQSVNPLCGDEFKVFLNIQEKIIQDLSFQCECCGISMASASMMTEMVKGKTEQEAHQTIASVRLSLKTGEQDSGLSDDLNAIFKTLVQFPSRINCASLGWTTLDAALRGKSNITLDGS